MLASLFRQVGKWACVDLEILQPLVNLFSIELIESGCQSFDQIKLAIPPKLADQQLSNALRTRDIAANEELILLIESGFLPVIDFLSRHIYRASALCDQPLNSDLLNHLNS